MRQAPQTRWRRRTRANIEGLKGELRAILEDDYPMTVRQVFYQAVSRKLIEKTEAAYKTVVCRLLGLMRRSGELPFDRIADNTRWMRKPDTYTGLVSMLEETARNYRRALWRDQRAYVEVWLEKDALAGVLYNVTGAWDVPLMVTRGYPSLSFLFDAAEAIARQGKPAHLYYFGDHDPSGVDIPRKVETDLTEFSCGAEIHFERVAVTRGQIEEWDLPTRPTKKTDSRSAGFEGESVEVDAIPAAQLRALVEACITKHVDEKQLEQTRRIEEQERETLLRMPELLKTGRIGPRSGRRKHRQDGR